MKTFDGLVYFGALIVTDAIACVVSLSIIVLMHAHASYSDPAHCFHILQWGNLLPVVFHRAQNLLIV